MSRAGRFGEVNGGRPARHWYQSAASAYWSVRASKDALAAGLFRRHVQRASDELTRRCHSWIGFAQEFCDPKIKKLRDEFAVDLSQENVGGFDIAMNDTAVVCGCERVGNRGGDFLQFAQREPSTCVEMFIERRSLKQFESHEQLSVLDSDVQDFHDVGMVQRGGCACLTKEPLCDFRRRLKLVLHEFDCHAPTRMDVHGFMNRSHPAFAQLP